MERVADSDATLGVPGGHHCASRHWISFVAIFLVLLAWSTYAYATVRVNADILAEAIQVQQWLQDPFWVWSYPGQLHGGVLEYPFIALAETVAPGNVYALTLLRVFYIPVTAVLLAACFAMAAPRRSLWPFAVAAAVGPAVLHGFRMISDIYPSAWLLAAIGVWLIFRWSSGVWNAVGWPLAGGLLIGLGIYQHASAAVFTVPMVVFALVHWRRRVVDAVPIAIGGVVGLLPMVVAMFGQPDKEVVYRPERIGLPNFAGALGLTPEGSGWRDAMLPNGLGITHADATFLNLGWAVQWWVNLIGLLFVIAVIVLGIVARKSAVGWMWLAAVVMLFGLVIMVPPIWYYGTPIGFLLWFSVGFAPVLLPRQSEWIVIWIVFSISAGFSFAQVWNSHPRFLTGAQSKLEQAAEIKGVAQGIQDEGLKYVFGDYWEVLPIAYASAGALHPISYNYNRFPLDPAEVGQEIVVAVTPGTIALPFGHESWTLSGEALTLVDEVCVPIPDVSERLSQGVTAHLCPTAILMESR